MCLLSPFFWVEEHSKVEQSLGDSMFSLLPDNVWFNFPNNSSPTFVTGSRVQLLAAQKPFKRPGW